MPGEVDYPKETAREPPIGLKIITTSPRGPSRLAADAAHPGQSQDGRLVGAPSGGHHLSRAETDGSTAAVSGRVAQQPHSHQDEQGWRGFFQRLRQSDCCLQRMTTWRDMVCTASCPRLTPNCRWNSVKTKLSPPTHAGRSVEKSVSWTSETWIRSIWLPPFPAPDSRRIRQTSLHRQRYRVCSLVARARRQRGGGPMAASVRTCWGAMLRPDTTANKSVTQVSVAMVRRRRGGSADEGLLPQWLACARIKRPCVFGMSWRPRGWSECVGWENGIKLGGVWR